MHEEKLKFLIFEVLPDGWERSEGVPGLEFLFKEDRWERKEIVGVRCVEGVLNGRRLAKVQFAFIEACASAPKQMARATRQLKESLSG